MPSVNILPDSCSVRTWSLQDGPLLTKWCMFAKTTIKPPDTILWFQLVPFPTIQPETRLVHAKVHEPDLNHAASTNFLPLVLALKRKARKVHTMWFANFRVNQPCFRLDCRERYRQKLPESGACLFGFPYFCLVSRCFLLFTTSSAPHVEGLAGQTY